MNVPNESEIQAIFERARETRLNAYAPYSNFRVGAAARIAGTDTIVSACNVENASLGATVCAERNMIAAIIAEYGRVEIENLVVVSDYDPPVVPCALCLQVLQEFCPQTLAIHSADTKSVRSTVTLADLLPMPFKTFEEKTH